MIIATPLNLPKIEPDNWDIFWKIWNKEAKPLTKIFMNHSESKGQIGNDNSWIGLDIYKKIYLNTSYDAPFFDIKNDLPLMHELIKSLPLKLMYRVRILQSLIDIPPHTDDNKNKWSIRAMLKCEDPESQWYFTKPYASSSDPKYYLKMPPDTNWFAYNDKHCWHGTTYNKKDPKLLIQIYSVDENLDLIKQSINKYSNYNIKINQNINND